MARAKVHIVGANTVIAEMNRQLEGAKDRSEAAMWSAVLLVEGWAKHYTPHRTGHLVQNTGREVRRTPGKIVGQIYYTASYAPYVHEAPEWHRFRKDRNPFATRKFLERGLAEKAKEVLNLFEAKAKIPGGTITASRSSAMTAAHSGDEVFGSMGSF